jgi:ribosome modulation factor
MDHTAYQQGIAAHRRELLPADCPYTSGDARASWMLGWKFAETGEVELPVAFETI